MFSIIDRYIIKKFLTTFFFMMGVIMILTTVFDLADKLNDFLQSGATWNEIFFDYYLNFILLYGNMFSAMIIFISVIWFTSKMAQDTEIIPIWNSGRNFGRYIRPFMISATLLMLLSLVVNHLLVPRANKVRLEFEEKYYWNSMEVSDYHAEYPGNQVVYFSSYSSSTGFANDFTVEQWDDKGNMLSLLHAKSAEENDGKWTMHDCFIHHYGDPKDRIVEKHKIDTSFQFVMSDMAKRSNAAEAMSYSELKEFIEKERRKGSKQVPTYETVLYERSSLPFSTYVLTIIGVAVASRKKRGGIGVNIALGLGIIFIYIFAMKVTSVAALNLGFPTYMAAWLPNILFGSVAYLLYRNVQR
ncbi:MAG: LptF/LptG family permease [Crocinitomicaceae bacterium]|nr:LptF/LptG family permease [Crocinitomicaceae bacterium]